MAGKSVDNNDDENYESLASGIERIKRNSKYLSNREKQQMDEIYYMLRYMLKENISSQQGTTRRVNFLNATPATFRISCGLSLRTTHFCTQFHSNNHLLFV